jgi:hypothetical protein
MHCRRSSRRSRRSRRHSLPLHRGCSAVGSSRATPRRRQNVALLQSTKQRQPLESKGWYRGVLCLETIFQLMMTIVGSNWVSGPARLFAFENKLKLLITLAFYTFRGCCKRRLAKREPVFLDSSSHIYLGESF